jgi:hypothetical protein
VCRERESRVITPMQMKLSSKYIRDGENKGEFDVWRRKDM